MASSAQIAANQANAKKSTGPKTASGKKAASKNALSHGLTTAPLLEDVLHFLRIILDDPLAIYAPMDRDPLTRAAHNLAEAEASVHRAGNIQQNFIRELYDTVEENGELSIVKVSKFDIDSPRRLAILLKTIENKSERSQVLDILKASPRYQPKQIARARTLRRYYCEAEARRRKAFDRWMAVN